MISRVLETLPTLGITRVHHYDETTDESHIETIQDVEPIITESKDIFKEFDERANWKGEMHRVASIPLSLYADLKAKGIVGDRKKMKAWLNDPDNRAFRTRPGWI